MPELWGEDDYLYGDYLKEKRRFPWLNGLLIIGVIYALIYTAYLS